MSSAALEAIIRNSCDLPTMPAVANKVIAIVADPDTTAADLNKVIMSDQAMAARVLKLANSSFYGCLRAITRLTQAISIIGFSSLKNVVLAASTKEVYKRFGLTEKMLHEHSSGAAIAAFQVAKELGSKNTEELFLVGLLHDIGKVVLNNSDSEKYQEVMQEVYNSGENFFEVENRSYGYTHADVGALVIKKWNLSPEMEMAVRHHHSIDEMNTADPYITQLACIVNLSDSICHKLGVGVRTPQDIDIASLSSTKLLKLTPERIEPLVEKINKAIEEEGNLLA